MDLWLWGNLNTLVHSAAISDLAVLHQRIEKTRQEIRVNPGICDRVRTFVRRRAEICVEMHGNHIEHLL
jgi:hypothetical protein